MTAMWWAATAGLLAAVVWWQWRFGGTLPRSMTHRGCQGAAWQRAFPQASKQDIREFLSAFVSAFAFKDSERLKLAPSDRLLDVYRALYPHQWTPDNLEFETLARDVQRRYELDLESVWHEQLTLGQLFDHLQSPRLPRALS